MKVSVLLLLSVSVQLRCLAQCDFKIYNQSFSSKIIEGTKGKCFIPEGSVHYTAIITPVKTTGTLNELLGSYYTTDNFNTTTALLNIRLDEPLPILDSIDFNYYTKYSFLNVLDTMVQFKENDLYKSFKKAFKASSNNLDRRKILYSEENNEFRLALENSKYIFINNTPPISFTLTTDIKREFTLGLAASITEQLQKSASFKGEMSAILRDSVSKYVEVKQGNYFQIGLNPQYIKIASAVFHVFANDIAKLDNYGDDFALELKSFLNNQNAAIITGASVIEATFDYSKYEKLVTSIGAAISANISITDSSKAPKIAANVTAKYSRDKTGSIQINTFKTFYFLRYSYDTKLEVGAGAH